MFAIVLFATLQAADPAWIEYGPEGPLARVIVTDGGKCPPITIDGVETKMRTHAEPAKHYEVRVCEAALPTGVQSASIGKTALPVAKLGKSAKVAILGDTGCSRKVGEDGKPPEIQNCGNPDAWPFQTIATSIAEWEPDVVLHVGDYYYREAKCKDGECEPATYDWKRWNADFFTPVVPLLSKAPWIFTRGNHEKCSRAAEGWFRFLDPRGYVWEGTKTCKANLAMTPPYLVEAGDLNVMVFDSSEAKESDEKQAKLYANQLSLLSSAKPGTWVMLHHPIWAIKAKDTVTETLWSAWQQAGTATSTASLVLSGHIHLVEMLSFSDRTTPQIVSGNGGTLLNKKGAQIGVGTAIGPRTVSGLEVDRDFGFLTATPSPDGWMFVVRSKKGKAKATCAMTSSGIVCD